MPILLGLRRVAGVHCVHYIGEKTVRLGLLRGLHERFPIRNLIR